jgi:FtsH-binding integral membrane protein
MTVGKKKQSVGLTFSGYAIFSLTFGVTLSLLLQRYDIATITSAFAITACISGIFLIAGVVFPQFFARIGGVLCVSLFAVIIVELVATMFLHIDQTFTDYIVILLFCGFLGYDSYLMSVDEATVPNAIFYAAEIYIDIINILVRVLDIMDRD